MPSLAENGPLTILKCDQCIFTILLLSPLKNDVFLPCSGEENENVNCERP